MKKVSEMTKQEKFDLLKKFLGEEILVKAIFNTLDDIQLNKWIEANMDTILIKTRNQQDIY